MTTIFTDDPKAAAEFIRRGGLVAFPTETVYGLGADAFEAAAVTKIFEAKSRPADNPLIVHISEKAQIARLVTNVTPSAEKLIAAFFPGPLSLVLESSPAVSAIVSAGLKTVGIRMTRHRNARAFLAACGTPVAAPSANLSGRPSPTTWQAVAEDLDGRIDCILQSDATDVGLESTVVDCTTDSPVVLRSGAVSLEELRSVIPEIAVYIGGAASVAMSPGMKHAHYSPRARVILTGKKDVTGSKENAAFIGLHVVEGFVLTRKVESAEQYARSVFEFFRECDRAGIGVIYCEPVEERGIGVALMDRLRRAAE